MTPSPRRSELSGPRLERLESLFWAAVSLDPNERKDYIAFNCAKDPDIEREVHRMLAAHDRAGSFLDLPLPAILDSDLPNSRIGRWQLLERVGEGGLGVVFRAECLEDGVRIEAAVKILRPGFDTGKFREKFVKERQILAGLDHPGVVRLIDCGADRDGRSFLVMDFVHGEPLNQRIERTNPAIADRLVLFRFICEAVAYLHSQLVVHGDIKPGNVLVTASGHPKLLDFGAAALLAGDGAERGEVTRLMLTPQYASPERKRGEGPSVAGDIYSLGRLLDDVLSGTDRNADLRYIVLRATAERPADRYLSVADLLEDLRRLREGFPLRARPATAAYVTARFLRRNWPIAVLIGLLVLSLAVGWLRAERASRLAAAAAAEAFRQRQAALAQERRAVDNETRAAASAEQAVSNAARLDALIRDLINDEDADADPNIVGERDLAAERSVRRAAASLEALPGPPRWRERSVAWRRLAMILVHKGEFTAAEQPLAKARDAALAWLQSEPSTAARRNALMVKLSELRLERQRGPREAAYPLAHEALANFRTLPSAMQAQLNGTVWLESARLSLVRELMDQNRIESAAALLTQVARNSHDRRLPQTRNLAVAHLVWAFRRLNRLDEARRWCTLGRQWDVVESRIPKFCAEPLTPFTEADELFPATPGALSGDELQSILSRVNQLVLDLHEDPRSFPLNINLGRAYARLAEHYLASGQVAVARPAVKQAASIRDALLAADSKSPVVLNFKRRVDGLEDRLNARE